MTPAPLTAPPATWVESRLAAHRLAVYVVSPARRRHTGRIGLRAGPGVYVTPAFGAEEEVVSLEAGRLVRENGGSRTETPVTTLVAAAWFVLGAPPDIEWAKEFDVPDPGDPDAPLPLDPVAATLLGDWYRFAWDALGELRAEAGGDASEIQLWPEHFDAAFDAAAGDGRITFGGSPGDHTSDEPYLYVLPPGPVEPGETWNAQGFAGAVLPLSGFLGEADQRAAALAFFRSRRNALS